jgi:cytochrome b561
MKDERFPVISRILHWLMAAMILTMLLLGIGMAASVSERYRYLVAIHRPLGVAILILAAIRLLNRLLNPGPALPASIPPPQRVAAIASHVLLYALMFIMPLVGWAMLSAAPYPVVLFGSLQLPPILAQDPLLYARLRHLHTYLAYAFFAVILVHLGAALLHALILRDGVFQSMASFARRKLANHPAKD